MTRQAMPTTEPRAADTALPGPNGLLERQAELRELDAAVQATAAGRGGLTVLQGEPGIGKSRLLTTLCERTRARDVLVLAASGLELERGFAFGLALRLLEPALDALDPARRSTVLSRAPAARALLEGRVAADVAGGADRGYALVHALRQVVVGLVDGAPLVIAVDDAHWADGPSLRFLAHLTAGLGALPVAVVVATRDDVRDAPGELLHALVTAPQARVLRLRPLSERAVERVVRGVFPHAAPAFWQACARTTRGNPFYLTELLECARAEGIDPSPRAAGELDALVPESVVHSVLLRMARLPDPAPALASAAAVLGDGAPLRQAAALAGVDGQAAEGAADALAAAHILRPGERLAFTHPLIASAVRADLPALARSRAHRRAAELLHADGAAHEAVAAHLLACRGEGDPRAVETLRAAASRAAAHGAHHAAQRLLERALAEPPARELRAGLTVELALAHAAVGAPDAVARVRDALEAVEDPARRVEILRALGRLLFARSEFDAAADAIEQAATESASSSSPDGDVLPDAAAIFALARASRGAIAARLGRVFGEAQQGRLPRDPRLLAVVASQRLAAGRPADEVARAARDALAGLPPDDGFYGIVTGFAVVALIGVDELESAARAIERALDHADQAGSLIAAGTATHWRAELRYHEGALEDAIAACEQTLEIARAGWDVCAAWVAPVLAHAHMDRADLDAAAGAVALAEDCAGERAVRALALAARGRLALERGDAAAALTDLLAAGAHAERHGMTQPTLLPWRSWASLAATRLGDREQADALAQTELAQARAVGAARTLGLALRAAGTARAGADGVALLAEAVGVLERSPSALERARALVALGAALRRDGQRTAAREPLRRGLDLAEALGATLLAGHASDELRAAGGRRRRRGADGGPAALTPTEQRVAQLAARGLSTPQIAQTLYVAAKTVDWHLGNVYRKLGINSRRQLPAIITVPAPR